MFESQRMVMLHEKELVLLIHAVGLAIDEVEANIDRRPDLERRAVLRRLEQHLGKVLDLR